MGIKLWHAMAARPPSALMPSPSACAPRRLESAPAPWVQRLASALLTDPAAASAPARASSSFEISCAQHNLTPWRQAEDGAGLDEGGEETGLLSKVPAPGAPLTFHAPPAAQSRPVPSRSRLLLLAACTASEPQDAFEASSAVQQRSHVTTLPSLLFPSLPALLLLILAFASVVMGSRSLPALPSHLPDLPNRTEPLHHAAKGG